MRKSLAKTKLNARILAIFTLFLLMGSFAMQRAAAGPGASPASTPNAGASQLNSHPLAGAFATATTTTTSLSYQFLTTLGSNGTGPGQFQVPFHVAVDPSTGSVYVADLGGSRIEKFSQTGALLTSWGSYCTLWPCPLGEFKSPVGIALNPSTGYVYVVDDYTSRVQVFTSAGGFVNAWNLADFPNEVVSGMAVAGASGNVYVPDIENNVVNVYDGSGTLLSRLGVGCPDPYSLRGCTAGNATGQFNAPWDVAVDQSSGNVYVTDTGNDRIEKFDSNGNFLTAWGSTGSGDGQFAGPSISVAQGPEGVAVDSTGNVLVTDPGNSRVEVFTKDGAFLTAFGSTGTGNGQFSTPIGVAVNQAGVAYVTDWAITPPPAATPYSRIEEFSPVVTTTTISSSTSTSSTTSSLSSTSSVSSSSSSSTSSTSTSVVAGCFCQTTGPFQDPSVANPVGITSPDGSTQVTLTAVSGTPVLDLTRGSTPIVSGLFNPLAWGWSPDSKYFVVANRPASLNPDQIDLLVYNTLTGNLVNNLNPLTITCLTPGVASDGGGEQSSGCAGWGFSPDGQSFVVSYLTGATTYKLQLYSTVSGAIAIDLDRSDASAFWQFSPCGDLFMLATDSGVFFYYSAGSLYQTESLNLVTNQILSATAAQVGSAFVIDLTGMSDTSISSPQCTTLTVVGHSPITILVTDRLGRRVGFDPTTSSIVNEIKGATYTGPASEPQTTTLPVPADTYGIKLVGTGTGTYSLTISISNGPNTSEAYFSGRVVLGETVLVTLDTQTLIFTVTTSSSSSTTTTSTSSSSTTSTSTTTSTGSNIPFTSGQAASVVLGASSMTTGCPQFPVLPVQDCVQPYAVAFDASGDLWVANSGFNRVLEFKAPFSNGEIPSLVLGQPNINSFGCSTFPTQSGLCAPTGLAFDALGNLWVSDTGNHRIVEFLAPFNNGESANAVIGQQNFTSGICDQTFADQGNPKLNELCSPKGIAFGPSGNLWVTDYNNYRVLGFAAPLSNDESASVVIGENPTGCAVTKSSLCQSTDITFDRSGDMWVTDVGTNRVVEFVPPFTTGMGASVAIGQPDLGNGSPSEAGINGCPPQVGGSRPLAANTLCSPLGVTFDSAGNLWISDSVNRVLGFSPPFTTGESASVVLGQGSFATDSCNPPTATVICSPTGVTFDQSGDLWVSDLLDSRVLEFIPTSTTTTSSSSSSSTTSNSQTSTTTAIVTEIIPSTSTTTATGTRTSSVTSTETTGLTTTVACGSTTIKAAFFAAAAAPVTITVSSTVTFTGTLILTSTVSQTVTTTITQTVTTTDTTCTTTTQPTGVPEFPLGLLLAIAVGIPVVFLVKRRERLAQRLLSVF